jgi:hypothetical protein
MEEQLAVLSVNGTKHAVAGDAKCSRIWQDKLHAAAIVEVTTRSSPAGSAP